MYMYIAVATFLSYLTTVYSGKSSQSWNWVIFHSTSNPIIAHSIHAIPYLALPDCNVAIATFIFLTEYPPCDVHVQIDTYASIIPKEAI